MYISTVQGDFFYPAMILARLRKDNPAPIIRGTEIPPKKYLLYFSGFRISLQREHLRFKMHMVGAENIIFILGNFGGFSPTIPQ